MIAGTEKSRTTAEVARELGLVEQTLGNWVTVFKREHAGELPAAVVTESERDELQPLRTEVRELRLEKEFLGRRREVQRAAGCYEWKDSAPTAAEQHRELMTVVVTDVFTDSDGTCRHRRVVAGAARRGYPIGPQTVRAVLSEQGLVAASTRKRAPKTTMPAAGDFPDLLTSGALAPAAFPAAATPGSTRPDAAAPDLAAGEDRRDHLSRPALTQRRPDGHW